MCSAGHWAGTKIAVKTKLAVRPSFTVFRYSTLQVGELKTEFAFLNYPQTFEYANHANSKISYLHISIALFACFYNSICLIRTCE